MAHPRHEEVRQRYQRCCGYCGVSEADTGAELTVDHYQPVTTGGDDSSDNLVYACFRCNTYKGDYFPTAEDLEHGRRILHPLLDPISEHLRENEATGLLEPLTSTGHFHVNLLRLNRLPMREHRIRRRLANLLKTTLELLLKENQALRRRLEVLEEYLRLLQIERGEKPD